jgi:hypothetical protein
VVEPDAGGEGEQLGGDPCSQSVQAAGAVAFEAEAVFEREEDRLDPLTDPRQDGPAAGFVLARGTQDPRAEALGGLGLEVASGVALVADDQLAAMQPDREQPQRDVAFFLVGGGQDRGPGRAVRGGQQVQPHAPKPA